MKLGFVNVFVSRFGVGGPNKMDSIHESWLVDWIIWFIRHCMGGALRVPVPLLPIPVSPAFSLGAWKEDTVMHITRKLGMNWVSFTGIPFSCSYSYTPSIYILLLYIGIRSKNPFSDSQFSSPTKSHLVGNFHFRLGFLWVSVSYRRLTSTCLRD